MSTVSAMREKTNHRRALSASACLLALICLAAPQLRAGQTPDVRAAKQRELEDVRQKIGQSSRRRESLEEEKRALRAEAEDISARLVALAAKRQAIEALIARNEKKIAGLEKEETKLNRLLAARRAAIAELLAGLQKLRRDPPPPCVTRPQDVLAAVRGAMLLSDAVPHVERRVARLLSDLRRLAAVRRQLIESQEEKHRNLAHLEKTGGQIRQLLARKRQLLRQTSARLEEENRRLRALTGKARNLNELISALRREEKRRRQAEAARLREEARRRAEAEKAAKEAGKPKPEIPPPAPRVNQKPRVAITTLKGRLPWPAQGRAILRFGEKSALDSRSRGIYVQTRPGASVIAPADGRVEVARKFRSYGQLLILNAGQGYRILLAGLGRTSVLAGQFVRAGEPLGEMGSSPAPATVPSAGVARDNPILYMELRKHGRPVNATLWWPVTRQEARKK